MLRGDGSNLAAARLQIVGSLGAGGFSAVYEAIDTRSGQRVAVKELDDTSADSITRFKQEFRALADCHHANLVGLQELIEQDGRWLIVMELVPGTDFLRYVRRQDTDNDNGVGEHWDETRLRTALIGMVEGLRALHDFGIVHRDLKPSNVRVRPDGRAVLLDFGLVTSVDPKQQSSAGMGVGTVVYMAPEQASPEGIGPAVDYYALGVCLFEALTGRAPFEGDHPLSLLLEKRRLIAPRASSLVSGVPHDLDELCARLLEIEPEKRPGADAVLSVLTRAPVVASVPPGRASLPEEVFAGREGELAHLSRALWRCHEGELRIVLVEGESGVGKSELVSEFLRRTQARKPELVALRGRCYENEQVSYKAFDGCIDELSRFLRRLPDSECAALMPKGAALLGQLFPVLRDVKAIVDAVREGSSADPSARRLEAFAALSRLFCKLCEERPLVLVLDDLQWADAESFRLLSALSQQDPRPSILLVGMMRPREELEPDVRERLEEVRNWQHTDLVLLQGLPREQARALAGKLLSPGTPAAWLDMIADESRGHPLFMGELQKYTQSHDFGARGTLTLEAALRARIDRLDRRARELLELVAVAARPYPSSLFADALSTNIDEAVRTLLRAKFLRQRKGQELGSYHDRIRHAAFALIAPSRLPALHRRLAAALERTAESDASEQARHWDLAGQEDQAISAYELAAKKAFDALAFTRAAQLCGRAIELASDRSDERIRRLTVRRADALAAAGLSGEAATLYQTAADAAHGDARIQLRGRAAMHLMLNAKMGPGFAAAKKLLEELGFSVPLGVGASRLRYAWDSFCAALPWFERPRDERGLARERLAVSVLLELLDVLGPAHPLASFVLGMQYVRRARRAGSQRDTILGLTYIGFMRAVRGKFDQSLPFFERAREQLVAVDDPQTLARYEFVVGSAHVLSLQQAKASAYLERAERLAREHCADNPRLLISIRHLLGMNWYFLGEHARLASEVTRWLAEARERKDALAVALLTSTGCGYASHLMNDKPELALRELEQTIAPIPTEPYAFTHLGQLLGTIYSLLYQGGPAAASYLDSYTLKHKRAFLLRTGTGHLSLLMCRALSSLAVCASRPEAERAPLLKAARRAVAELDRVRSASGRALAALGYCQLEALEGKRSSALGYARTALSAFRELHHVYEHTTLYLEGVLEGGASRAAKCEGALAALRAQGWLNPLRAIGIGAPLYQLLSERAGDP